MIKTNLERVRERIARAAIKSGRNSSDIRLVCVTKGVSVGQIQEVLACGIQNIGENRVQEVIEKQPFIGRTISWHLIGQLQRNKSRRAVELFDWIHSVDRLELASALERIGREMNRSIRVLMEVNASGIPNRSGAAPEQAAALAEEIRTLPHLQLDGLMVMAPYSDNPETVRPIFRQARELAEKLKLPQLSMGMSNDFEVAVEEGATMVRIGTAIFGERE